MLNALSIDVEEWYHAELIRSHLGERAAIAQVGEATSPLLDLLERYGVQATFFIVGEVLECAPELVRDIAARGHEIGCHSMSHRMLTNLTPEAFRQELAAFGQAAQALGLQGIEGFRAPTFSVDNRTRWAVPLLREFGYRYDSSVFPLRNPMYGVNHSPLTPYPLDPQDVAQAAASTPDALWEFPMSVWQCGPLKVPVSGGFYMRIMPLPILTGLLSRINRQGRPFVIYLHPWETYQDTPRLPLPAVSRWVTYVNTGSMLRKLEQLLQRFQFGPIRQVLTTWQANHPASIGG